MPATRTRAPRLVAFLSDFGSSDHYVATVKGVILSIDPSIRIVDITHAVAPQNVREAGYHLRATHRFFPKGTLFLSVVDPGVGTDRPIHCAQVEGRTFLAPANGLLDFILFDKPDARVFEISQQAIAHIVLRPTSSTFHGRDIFAPLAARIAGGAAVARFGKRIPLKPVADPFVRASRSLVPASVLHVDGFGNCVTNILPEADRRPSGLRVGRMDIVDWKDTYASSPANKPFLLIGSDGLVEVSVNGGSAARVLGVHPGSPVEVRW